VRDLIYQMNFRCCYRYRIEITHGISSLCINDLLNYFETVFRFMFLWYLFLCFWFIRCFTIVFIYLMYVLCILMCGSICLFVLWSMSSGWMFFFLCFVFLLLFVYSVLRLNDLLNLGWLQRCIRHCWIGKLLFYWRIG
jgi:hypothetical protein